MLFASHRDRSRIHPSSRGSRWCHRSERLGGWLGDQTGMRTPPQFGERLLREKMSSLFTIYKNSKAKEMHIICIIREGGGTYHSPPPPHPVATPLVRHRHQKSKHLHMFKHKGTHRHTPSHPLTCTHTVHAHTIQELFIDAINDVFDPRDELILNFFIQIPFPI